MRPDQREYERSLRRQNQSVPRPGTGCNPRLLIGLIMAIVAIVSYLGSGQTNPVTGEVQRVSLTTEQEVALGLQAAPEMAAQHGGFEERTQAAAVVDRVGARLLNATPAGRSPYQFEFHLLKDPETINAFALPGGQIFITRALFNRLESEGQLAGVLGHEIAHVIQRHGAEQMAKQGLLAGLAGAAAVGTDGGGQMAAVVANLLSLKYGRDDELEADQTGLEYMALAGYDPNAMVGVMRILDEASGSGGPPEMLSTHPKPANRIGYIQDLIKDRWPSGLPSGLTP